MGHVQNSTHVIYFNNKSIPFFSGPSALQQQTIWEAQYAWALVEKINKYDSVCNGGGFVCLCVGALLLSFVQFMPLASIFL